MDSDIAIVGGGVMGVTAAYWLSELYDCRIVVVEKEPGVARQTTLRNTGVIHRPYYLNPAKRRVFATAAGRSYEMWKQLAARRRIPWLECGTLMVATEAAQLRDLDDYSRWAEENGMGAEEFELMDPREVSALEPEVSCSGAFLSRTDTSTSFSALTKEVWNLAAANGVTLLPSARLRGVRKKAGRLVLGLDGGDLGCSLMVNAAGGGALDIAHMMGLASGYTDLHFRGEYWQVDGGAAPRVGHNIYSVAKHPEFNFLDPHFIDRADGRREVGPNAVLVAGPDTYSGAGSLREILGKVAEVPLMPKLKLFGNSTFLSLVAGEWRTSLSKRAMCGRVRKFIPALRSEMLVRRGLSGVRSSLVGDQGFVPEALLLSDESSLHVLNFNSPGATGAPAYSALMVASARNEGLLDRFRQKEGNSGVWDFESAAAAP